jgi:TRAP-type mannitol/chloroaromatic compound transport system permease small subunit
MVATDIIIKTLKTRRKSFNNIIKTSKFLINIFIQFIYTFMIDLSSEQISNTIPKERPEQPLYEPAQL